MNNHIGNDSRSHTHFRIVDVDANAGCVLVEYDQNLWFREQEQARQISWVEFVEGLKEGRFEIHRNS
jgi:hypothetical protein